VAVLILLLLVTLIGVPTLMWAPLSPGLREALTFAVTAAATLALLQGWLYGTAVFWISWRIAREQGRDLRWQLPDVIAAYHFGYGLGSIRGWWDALVRRRPDPAFGRLTR
jgi:succinoglycan biosynthesis protein ExoA